MQDLKVDFCAYQAAKYACLNWHYSKAISVGRQLYFGVWEDGKFVGAVVYGKGANRHIGDMYGLTMWECAELTRIALSANHNAPVSRIIAITLKMLKKHSPDIRLIISYADLDQDHHGGIYQATNWIYQGQVELNGGTPKYRIHGRVFHARHVHSQYGRGSQKIGWLRANVDPNAECVYTKGKHKYLYPLDDDMKNQIASLAKPYPKRVRSADSGTGGNQLPSDGANPIRTLNTIGCNNDGA